MSARTSNMSQLIPFGLFAFFLLFSLRVHDCVADDRLFQGHSISGDRTIVSSGGKFELGFFTPGNSLKYYIGIWYYKLPKQTVVWVANREHPVSNHSSSEFKVGKDGYLVLLNDSKNQVWSSNYSNSLASNSTIAVLQDDGNLILQDNLSSNILWQSFDHPTHYWLPGAKLGYNKFTGIDRFLSSWRNSEDPSPGLFTFEIDPDGVTQLYLLKDRRHRYYTPGVWLGDMFSEIPEMKTNMLLNYVVISNSSVNEFSYNCRDSSNIGNFLLDYSGVLRRMVWYNETEWLQLTTLPRDPCDVEGRCGRFSSCNNYTSKCQCLQGFKPKSSKKWNLGEHTEGCIRKNPLQCGEKDGFLELSTMQQPVNSTRLSMISGPEECRIACLRNCSCTAYAYQSQCSIWYGDLFDLKSLWDGSNNETRSGVIYIRVEASELADHELKNKGKKSMTIILSAMSGVAATMAVIGLLLGLRCCQRAFIEASELVQGPLVAFKYKVLRKATKDFSKKLGCGSFGSVFKGELPDSTAIAVKRLECIRQGEKQFRMEVSTIGMIHHVNVVRLRGFCCEGDKRLLVYDYMPMGSLNSILFADGSEVVLDWKKRYQIALGIARGLAYLHEKCRECIMHCDIKPENILLDIDMSPKIADFGMAKLLGHDYSRVLTTMRGTIGYLAPEWITGSAITPKADVYSFGLMLLEIVSGRRNIDAREDLGCVYFPHWAATKLHEGDSLCLLDSKLKDEADEEEVGRVCRIACWCIQDVECNRPTMGEVVQLLEGVLDAGLPPIPGLLQKLVIGDYLESSLYSSSI